MIPSLPSKKGETAPPKPKEVHMKKNIVTTSIYKFKELSAIEIII